MWGGAFDPEPRAPAAPAPYPDGKYAMTSDEFDSRVQGWTDRAHDGSFDASITDTWSFRDMTRHREVRAVGVFAFAALVPLTASVWNTNYALLAHGGSSFDVDPETRAMAISGQCDRRSDAVDVLATRGRVATALFLALVVTLATISVITKLRKAVRGARVGEIYTRVTRLLKKTENTKIRDEKVMCMCKQAEVASPRTPSPQSSARRDAPANALDVTPDCLSIPQISTPRVSPPPPPPPPPTMRKGSLGPLRRCGSTGTPPPPPSMMGGRGTSLLGTPVSISSSPLKSSGGLRRSLAMSALRRTVSHRANAKLRSVNLAANEAPTSAVAKRVKSKLNPADVLQELTEKSPYLAASHQEAEAHAAEISNLRTALEALDGTAAPETVTRLRDDAEKILRNLTDEPRVLRELGFPEARLESLRVAAANRDTLLKCATEAHAFGGTGSTNTQAIFREHRACVEILDKCVGVCDAVASKRAGDENRFTAAGISFDWRAVEHTREAAVAMAGRRLRYALAFCKEGREKREYKTVKNDSLFEERENANPNISLPIGANAKSPKSSKSRWGASVAGAVTPEAFELWVLRSASDLAYRAYAGCGGVDDATEVAAEEAETEIGKFNDDAWRGAEIFQTRASAAAKAGRTY